MASTELATIPEQHLATFAMPTLSMAQVDQRFREMQSFVAKILKEGLDYGTIPGTKEKTLMQPGAEKLGLFFGLSSEVVPLDVVKDWSGAEHGGEPFFEFTYRCIIRKYDQVISIRDASCNTWETKYRYRWVRSDSPLLDSYKRSGKIDTLQKRGGTMYEFVWAVNKRETGGKWGKPAEYWDMWKRAIDAGRAVSCKRKLKGKEQAAWMMHDFEYRITNPDPADCVNTAQKIAGKRAFVSAMKAATGASEYFTVDLEDFEKEEENQESKGKKTPYSTGETRDEIVSRRIAEEHEKAARGKVAANGQNGTTPDDPGEELDAAVKELWSRMTNLSQAYKAMGELKEQMKAIGPAGEAEYYRILSTFDGAQHANDIKRPDQLRMAAAAIFQTLRGLAQLNNQSAEEESGAGKDAESAGDDEPPEYGEQDMFDDQDGEYV